LVKYLYIYLLPGVMIQEGWVEDLSIGMMRGPPRHYCCLVGCDKGGENGKFLNEKGEEKSLLICSGCESVFYCSKEHQKADWKRHKGPCRASKDMPSLKVSYDAFVQRNKSILILITQGILWGNMIKTHVIYFQAKELKGGAIAFTSRPGVCALADIPQEYEQIQFICDANTQFWAMCPPIHKHDRIAHVVWHFTNLQGETSFQNQMLGGGCGPINILVANGMLQQNDFFCYCKMNEINEKEVSIARRSGATAADLAIITPLITAEEWETFISDPNFPHHPRDVLDKKKKTKGKNI